ncbi:MAG: virulence RhuM family protein [Victivallales bacterium]|nr:virulence RhuM family protein [Victivallales bacterium]
MSENQIIIYQPDEITRLEVRMAEDTVWLTQSQMTDLFQRDRTVVTRHINNVFAEGELEEKSNVHFLHIASSDKPVKEYSLNVVISVGYRVKSFRGTQFRIWATNILREYLLRGYAVNQRLNQLEDKMDRRLAKHDGDIAELKDKVDFFVQASLPPMQGVFYDGQLWDAHALVERMIGSAKKTILLIDNWATVETLDMLAKRRDGVDVMVVTSEHRDRLGTPRPKNTSVYTVRYNAQYPTLTVKYSEAFHDRFLVLDDAELYLIGASLKDLGKKCFGFMKMDASEIPGLKARI